MPIVPVKLASAGACLRAWAFETLDGDLQLAAVGVKKVYKDRVPEAGKYPCARYLIDIQEDVYGQQRGSGAYIETPARLLVSVHSDKANDEVVLATCSARIRELFELQRGSNDFGEVVSCFYLRDWEPAIASLETTGKEYSATGVWFEVWIKRARLA